MALTVTVNPGGGATEKDVEIELSTETIQISGSDIALEQVGDTINLGTINLADYDANTTLTFAIPTFEGVTNDSGETEVDVKLTFQGLAVREITVEDFEITGVPEGYEAEIVTEKLVIRVRGPVGTVSKLTARDMVVGVDFTGEEAGDATIRVTVTFSDKFEGLGVLGKPSVTTSLKEIIEEG